MPEQYRKVNVKIRWDRAWPWHKRATCLAEDLNFEEEGYAVAPWIWLAVLIALRRLKRAPAGNVRRGAIIFGWQLHKPDAY